MKRLDLVGQRFGRLEVIDMSDIIKYGKTEWICRCDCGNITKPIRHVNLKKGITQSCGCLQKEIASKTAILMGKNNKGKEAWNKGIPMTVKQKERFIGKNNPSWNPNLTEEDRQYNLKYRKIRICGYNEWRKQVFEKDLYTCQKCGLVGSKLRAHHIESFNNNPVLRTTIENGITLCKKCHKDFHHRYGKGNNNRKQLMEFMEK